VGHALAIVEVAINAVDLHQSGYSNQGFAKSGMGFGFMFIAAFGGPLGWTADGIYVIGESTGLLDDMFGNYSNARRTGKQ